MESKGVYTIEHLPEVKQAELRRSKVGTLAAALLLATAIVLAATAALVYALRTVHREYRPTPAASSSWAAEMMVSGEFRITNEPFRNSLYNLSSPDFKQLATRIEKELSLLYRYSGLEVQGVAVTSLGPGLMVRCSLALRPQDNVTIGKIGLAFLAGLNHTRGHLSLGPFYVDVLSIGFQARTEEVSWSQWSDWGECALSEEGKLVRQRRRVCLSQDGLKLRRSEPCEAVGGGEGESVACPPATEPPGTSAPPATSPAPPATTTAPPATTPAPPATATPPPATIPSTTTSFPITKRTMAQAMDGKVPPWVAMLTREATLSTTQASTTTSQPAPQPTPGPTINLPKEIPVSTTTTTTQVPEKVGCSVCEDKEVCVALEGDTVPLCRPVLDPADPTGCGGLCKIDTEVCHRLGQGAYRCLDDSKCLDNEWQCGNALCIPLIKRCDGHFNCYDHTDEHNCDCDLKNHFQCGKNLSCLPQSKRCDGVVDCWDAADESNCTIACLDETQFTCNDSQCIPSKNFCDGFVDCKDHSDEPFGCGGVCKNHEWRCRNGRCIVKRDVCNGQDDCGDFSDEIKCGKRRGAKILS